MAIPSETNILEQGGASNGCQATMVLIKRLTPTAAASRAVFAYPTFMSLLSEHGVKITSLR